MSTVEPILKSRRGNPNFGKKKTDTSTGAIPFSDAARENEPDLNKQYIFQLTKTHESQKPRDGKSGEMVNSPYQPFYAAVNSGLAWDPEYTPKNSTQKGGPRPWRYLYNFPTIWVDEQIDPLPSREDLSSTENDIIFRQGVLRVFGHEPMKLKALQLNNEFAGCVRPMKNIPKSYELLDLDKIDKESLQMLDDSFEAEKAAREMTPDEMYSIAYYYGIDGSKSDDAIRKELINRARNNPKVFNREYKNPKNKYKYTFLSAMADNYISDTIVPGTVYFVDSNTKVWDLKGSDTADELATNCMANNEKAMKIYRQIDEMYSALPS